jgi:hypothetical protein
MYKVSNFKLLIYLDDEFDKVKGLGLYHIVSNAFNLVASQQLAIDPVEELSLAVQGESVFLDIQPEGVLKMHEFVMHANAQVLTEVRDALLDVVLIPKLGDVGDRDADGVPIGVVPVVEVLVVRLEDNLPVGEHLGEHFVERRQNNATHISTVVHCNTQSVDEHVLVDAVARPAGNPEKGFEILGEVKEVEQLDHLSTVGLIVHREDVATGQHTLSVRDQKVLDVHLVLKIRIMFMD